MTPDGGGGPDTASAPAIPDARADELTTDRGTTEVAPGAIATIARQAASEVEGVEAVGPTGLSGALAPFRSSSAGGATAEVAARRVAIDLDVAVHWPRSVATVTAQVRDHVRARVQELTGHVVTDVDIVVVDLPVPTPRATPRVR
jgi:uncharacterized alkaline shock family protein YloU